MTPNGVLDPSFGVGGVQTHERLIDWRARTQLTGVAIDSSGNVVVGGDLRLIAADQSVYFAARYNSHGTLDASFNHGGIALAIASESPTTFEGGIAVQSGGQVLLGGLIQVTGTTPGVVPVVALCRLNEDGSPDTGFGDAGEVIKDFGSTQKLPRIRRLRLGASPAVKRRHRAHRPHKPGLFGLARLFPGGPELLQPPFRLRSTRG